MSIPVVGITCEPVSGPVPFLLPYSGIEERLGQAVESSGGAPIMIPLLESGDALRAVYGRLHGLLLSGGQDVDPAFFGESKHPDLGLADPRRDRQEMALIDLALLHRLPLLGICRGIQILNVALGGSLYQDLPAQCPSCEEHGYVPNLRTDQPRHTVGLAPGSRVSQIFGRPSLWVNSWHHQAVKELGSGLTVTGQAPDGVVEVIEGTTEHFVVGVQWHPELLIAHERSMLRLFNAFVEEARRFMSGDE